jgi:Tfp pilus assembly protein PilV
VTSTRVALRGLRRSQAGDTLMEVLISALLIAAIVGATVAALNTSNRASALGRARSEAQALAEQDQERVRAEPLATLAALNGTTETRPTVAVDGTTFTIKSGVLFVTESGTNDCTVETPTAGLYRTTSTVTWAASGKHAPVSLSSSIAPPAGATLVVRIEGPIKGEGVEHATVTATGPGTTGAVHTATTNSEGCALFGPYEEGGEYAVNAYRAGYVDPNSYYQLKEDPSLRVSWNLLTNLPTKASYQLAAAESLKVSLQTAKPTGVTGTWAPKTKANNVVIATAEGMAPAFRTLLSTSAAREGPFSSVAPGLYPFTYAVWAGTCKSDEPAAFGAAHNPEATAQIGGSSEVTLVLPALVLKIYKGTRLATTELATSPTVYLTNTSCEEGRVLQETLANTERIVEQGALASPGVPYGKYTVCTQWESSEGAATTTTTTTTSTSGAPIVTKQPKPQALVEGEAIIETAEASGAVSQQWEISFNNGSSWANLNGATSSPYNFGGSYVAQNNALFRDNFTNTHGSTLTNTAILYVTTTSPAPVVTKQPVAQALVEGEAIIENAEASGATSQQWEASFNNGSTWQVLGSATSSPYNFGASYLAQNNALFRDNFTNSHGSRLTNTALLTVTAVNTTYHLEATQLSVPAASQTVQELNMFRGNTTERKAGTC